MIDFDKLHTHGFCIINVLDIHEVSYLLELCKKYLHTGATDFVSSSHYLDADTSAFINTELHKILAIKLQDSHQSLELLGGTLAAKYSGKSILDVHNDWSIVDESGFHSYNIWMPLVDTSAANGTLGLISGSHLWEHGLRGMNIPNPFATFNQQFLSIGYEPSLQAGQAIIYDHRLLHYSRPNTTSEPRYVAIVGMKDKAASLCVSFLKEDNNIYTYSAAQEDFYNFDIKNFSNRTPIRKDGFVRKKYAWKNITQNFELYAPKEFLQKTTNSDNFIGRLRSIFK